jgi:hypothetical protein
MPEEMSQEEVFQILDELGTDGMDESEIADHLVEEYDLDPANALKFAQDYQAALEAEADEEAFSADDLEDEEDEDD